MQRSVGRAAVSAPAAGPASVPFRRVDFSDSDELASSFATWGMELTQLGRESAAGWTASGGLKNLNVWTTVLTGRYRVRTGLPRQSVLLQLDLASSGSRRLGKNTLAGDDILVGFAGAEIDGVVTEHHHGMSFVIPQELVNEALELRAQDADIKAIRPGSAYVLANCAPKVAALRRLASDVLGGGEQEAATPDRSDVILNSLLDALLEPWERATAATFRLPHSQCLPVVRRVEEFMRHRLGEQIMLHDLCRAGRASQRTVEYAFSSVYGVGPKQYLKLLRLNEVRRTLKAKAVSSMSVADTARSFGFSHMGHFFGDYRNLFGETPNQTRTVSGPITLRAEGLLSSTTGRMAARNAG
jgi:AraC family transcriptional regulator, ethanolamine operon transcriptional activator